HPAILERAGRILTFMLEVNSVALVKTRAAFRVRDDQRFVDVEHMLANSPHAALVDCFPAAAARVKYVSHTRCAPLRAIGATRESVSRPSFARRIAVRQFIDVAVSTIAKIVGPDPLIKQRNAPASSAARLTSRKRGI